MNTKNMTPQQISAFADGEANDTEMELALAALRTDPGREAWDLYHRTGDALRSNELAFDMRPDFMARMRARLDDEPTIMAPAARAPAPGAGRRFVVPGVAAIAAAAATAFALIGAPQLVAERAPQSHGATMLASATVGSASAGARVVSDGQNEILRDPAIDQYLIAHQRFSPSLYSTAQYARSATFANNPDK